MYKYY